MLNMSRLLFITLSLSALSNNAFSTAIELTEKPLTLKQIKNWVPKKFHTPSGSMSAERIDLSKIPPVHPKFAAKELSSHSPIVSRNRNKDSAAKLTPKPSSSSEIDSLIHMTKAITLTASSIESPEAKHETGEETQKNIALVLQANKQQPDMLEKTKEITLLKLGIQYFSKRNFHEAHKNFMEAVSAYGSPIGRLYFAYLTEKKDYGQQCFGVALNAVKFGALDEVVFNQHHDHIKKVLCVG